MALSPMFWTPPEPPRTKRGLFTAATVVTDNLDPHMLGGIEYVTNRCSGWNTWIDLCDTVSSMTLSDPSTVTGFAFAVYETINCDIGLSEAEVQEMARTGLEAKTEAAVEAQLQDYVKTNGNDYSATIGARQDPRLVVELLEYEAGQQYSHRPILHLDRGTATGAYAEHVIEEPSSADQPLETITGTAVVLGRGYTRSALGQYFGAMTGAVTVALGPVNVDTVPATSDAERVVLASRGVSVAVECVIGWAEV